MIFDYDTLDSDNFNDIANKILNERVLSVNGKLYRIAEIEFYLHNENHPDTYVHCNQDQLLHKCFYFHKFGNGTYKGGTFKGMDITFGDESSDTYFGILIRAIYDIEEKQMIEGPCNTVNRILSDLQYDSIIDFTKNKTIMINNKKLSLIKDKNLKEKTIWVAPRIGLSNKYPEYRQNLYRYVIYKNLIKKEKTKLIKL